LSESAPAAEAHTSLTFETVSHSPHGLYARSVLAQLLTQPHHLNINRTIRNGIVITMHTLDDLVAGKDDPWLSHKKVQQLKFSVREISQLLINTHLASLRINHKALVI
jgi:hypothetical protein